MSTKTALRQQCLAVRNSLTSDARKAFDEKILRRSQELLSQRDFALLHLFLPIERQAEINTWPLLQWLWQTYPKAQTVVPVLTLDKIEQVAVTPATHFKPNNLGIPEPVDGVALRNILIDIIIVPLLGFDSRGYRLGYGKGHYDQFLISQCTALKVGLAYDCLKLDFIPTQPHDVPLDAIITPTHILRFA